MVLETTDPCCNRIGDSRIVIGHFTIEAQTIGRYWVSCHRPVSVLSLVCKGNKMAGIISTR